MMTNDKLPVGGKPSEYSVNSDVGSSGSDYFCRIGLIGYLQWQRSRILSGQVIHRYSAIYISMFTCLRYSNE
ncbi:hypothetical protein [Serratia ficaria]|uniref:hypothetical protein n=1 Tax=Serratia ficaria TaxID=61651 RepID=UPI0011AB855C|nr:hypothetical protein [Serratia ficaria]